MRSACKFLWSAFRHFSSSLQAVLLCWILHEFCRANCRREIRDCKSMLLNIFVDPCHASNATFSAADFSQASRHSSFLLPFPMQTRICNLQRTCQDNQVLYEVSNLILLISFLTSLSDTCCNDLMMMQSTFIMKPKKQSHSSTTSCWEIVSLLLLWNHHISLNMHPIHIVVFYKVPYCVRKYGYVNDVTVQSPWDVSDHCGWTSASMSAWMQIIAAHSIAFLSVYGVRMANFLPMIPLFYFDYHFRSPCTVISLSMFT
jgi:hypothetical protein